MKIVRLRSIVVLFFVLLPSRAAIAATVNVIGYGIWGPAAGTTSWTAPNTSWQFSFTVLNPPSASGVGQGFNITSFNNFAYYLGGTPVNTVPDHMHLYSSSAGGGWLIDDFDGLSDGLLLVLGTQLYTGLDASPTLLTGTFSPAGARFDDSVGNHYFASTSTFSISTVPEPADWILVGVGLVGIWGRRRHMRRRDQKT